MSWYVDMIGRQVWIDREETVLTVGEAPAEGDLGTENLAYLTSASSKAVYAEHIIDDGVDDKKGKRAKEKASGRQRGFVVRLDGDSRTKVVAPLQGAADFLAEAGTVTRIDLGDSAPSSKRKGKKEDKKEPEEEILVPLGANEVRVETRARVQHFAHGKGFMVDVLEPGNRQRLHMFTDRELSAEEWHKSLVEAIQSSGRRLALGRMACEDGPPSQGGGGGGGGGRGLRGVVQQAPVKRDEAQHEEEQWLSSLMGGCMVAKPEKSFKSAEGSDGAEGGGGDGEGGEQASAKPVRRRANAPPWLRR